MMKYYTGDPKRIQHFIKVYQFAKMIGELEKLPEEVQYILETAAIVHDIGIKPAEEKYGSCGGKLQEQEGPAAAYTPSGYAPRVSMPVRSPHPAGVYQPSSQVSAADTAASVSLKIQCRPFAAVQCPASSHPVCILKWHLLLHKGLRPVPQPLTLGLL